VRPGRCPEDLNGIQHPQGLIKHKGAELTLPLPDSEIRYPGRHCERIMVHNLFAVCGDIGCYSDHGVLIRIGRMDAYDGQLAIVKGVAAGIHGIKQEIPVRMSTPTPVEMEKPVCIVAVAYKGMPVSRPKSSVQHRPGVVQFLTQQFLPGSIGVRTAL